MVRCAMTNSADAQPLIVEPLPADLIAAVFPLMRSANPNLSLAVWRRFAKRAVSGAMLAPHGVLIARRPSQRYPSGAVCYSRHRDIHQASILTAEHFVAMDLLYPEKIIEALITGLEPVATRLGCASIRSIVHGHAETLIDKLQNQGHSVEAMTMTKQVTQAAAAQSLPSHSRPA